jgi:hypothetical protein
MKFIAPIHRPWWQALSDNERNAMMDECIDYDDVAGQSPFPPAASTDSPERAATCAEERQAVGYRRAVAPKPRNNRRTLILRPTTCSTPSN